MNHPNAYKRGAKKDPAEISIYEDALAKGPQRSSLSPKRRGLSSNDALRNTNSSIPIQGGGILVGGALKGPVVMGQRNKLRFDPNVASYSPNLPNEIEDKENENGSAFKSRINEAGTTPFKASKAEEETPEYQSPDLSRLLAFDYGYNSGGQDFSLSPAGEDFEEQEQEQDLEQSQEEEEQELTQKLSAAQREWESPTVVPVVPLGRSPSPSTRPERKTAMVDSVMPLSTPSPVQVSTGRPPRNVIPISAPLPVAPVLAAPVAHRVSRASPPQSITEQEYEQGEIDSSPSSSSPNGYGRDGFVSVYAPADDMQSMLNSSMASQDSALAQEYRPESEAEILYKAGNMQRTSRPSSPIPGSSPAATTPASVPHHSFRPIGEEAAKCDESKEMMVGAHSKTPTVSPRESSEVPVLLTSTRTAFAPVHAGTSMTPMAIAPITVTAHMGTSMTPAVAKHADTFMTPVISVDGGTSMTPSPPVAITVTATASTAMTPTPPTPAQATIANTSTGMSPVVAPVGGYMAPGPAYFSHSKVGRPSTTETAIAAKEAETLTDATHVAVSVSSSGAEGVSLNRPSMRRGRTMLGPHDVPTQSRAVPPAHVPLPVQAQPQQIEVPVVTPVLVPEPVRVQESLPDVATISTAMHVPVSVPVMSQQHTNRVLDKPTVASLAKRTARTVSSEADAVAVTFADADSTGSSVVARSAVDIYRRKDVQERLMHRTASSSAKIQENFYVKAGARGTTQLDRQTSSSSQTGRSRQVAASIRPSARPAATHSKQITQRGKSSSVAGKKVVVEDEENFFEISPCSSMDNGVGYGDSPPVRAITPAHTRAYLLRESQEDAERGLDALMNSLIEREQEDTPRYKGKDCASAGLGRAMRQHTNYSTSTVSQLSHDMSGDVYSLSDIESVEWGVPDADYTGGSFMSSPDKSRHAYAHGRKQSQQATWAPTQTYANIRASDNSSSFQSSSRYSLSASGDRSALARTDAAVMFSAEVSAQTLEISPVKNVQRQTFDQQQAHVKEAALVEAAVQSDSLNTSVQTGATTLSVGSVDDSYMRDIEDDGESGGNPTLVLNTRRRHSSLATNSGTDSNCSSSGGGKASSEDIKEITLSCAPGEFTTLVLRFSNRRSHRIALRPRAILVRFDRFGDNGQIASTGAGSPEKSGAMDTTGMSMSGLPAGSTFQVSPTLLSLQPGQSASLYITFTPAAGEASSGVYGGALKMKTKGKSFVVLLRGEARIPQDRVTAMPHVAPTPERKPAPRVQSPGISLSPDEQIAFRPRVRVEPSAVAPQPKQLFPPGAHTQAQVHASQDNIGVARARWLHSWLAKQNGRSSSAGSNTHNPLRDTTDVLSLTIAGDVEGFHKGTLLVRNSEAITAAITCTPTAGSALMLSTLAATLSAGGCCPLEITLPGNMAKDSVSSQVSAGGAGSNHVGYITLSTGAFSHVVAVQLMHAASQPQSKMVSTAAVPKATTAATTTSKTQVSNTVILTASQRQAHAVNKLLETSQAMAAAAAITLETPVRPNVWKSMLATPNTQDQVSKTQLLSAPSAVAAQSTSASDRPDTLEVNASGLYFKERVAAFGSVSIGALSRQTVDLCNPTAFPLLVRLSDPDLPFVLLHPTVHLQAGAFVRIPVRFVPLSAREYSSELHAAAVVATEGAEKGAVATGTSMFTTVLLHGAAHRAGEGTV